MKKQFILIRKDTKNKTEYMYGPFLSMRKAWDWASEELAYAQVHGETVLAVKELYKPINDK